MNFKLISRGAAGMLCIGAVLGPREATAGDDENWPQWRGPSLNGVSEARDVPTTWSETENVIWKTPLPSWSGATPIVWGDRVFVMSPSSPTSGESGAGEAGTARTLPGQMGGREKPGGKDVLLLCFARKDGKLLWERTLGSGNRLFGKQNMASPSPVTDGKTVWSLTGTGVLSAFDFEGKERWKQDLVSEHGEITPLWGYGSSPLLHEGKIIVQVLCQPGFSGGRPSFVAAYEGASGKLLWKVDRITDAEKECPDAYTTPTLSRCEGGRTDLIITGADWITGHDPATGQERWRASGLNPGKIGMYRIVASPVAVDGVIIAPTRVKPLLAVKPCGSGDVSGTHVLWKYEKSGSPDVPTPACDGKYVYLLDDKGIIVCLEAQTGKRVWGPQRTAIGTVSASPVLADGKLYITNESATTTVLAAGPEHKVLATNALDDTYTISTPAICGGQVFVRTSSHLYCIGAKGGETR